ncbi:MAG: SE1561 family protein [Bacillaceae bacterium]
MGKSIHDKDAQLTYLKERLNMFMEVIDAIEPETVELEDLDRLLQMLDDMEMKMGQFKVDEE